MIGRDGLSAEALVLFTPLPPKPNGIADYSYELLQGLVKDFACTVVVEDEQGAASAPDGVAIIAAAEYVMHPERYAGRLHIYQVGNNRDHAYMLPFMSAQPGVVVLHDPSLHHLLDNVSASVGDFARYTDALEAESGAAGRVLGRQFERFRLRERSMFFEMPMIHGVAAPSRGVIVHSRYAAAKVLARAPETPVTVVPHQYSPPRAEDLEDRASVRRQLGIADDEILFMSLGFVTRSKCIDAALRALAIARDRLPPFKYVIAGELRVDEIDVDTMAASLGLDDKVIALGYVEERRFFALARAADVVINLRYPVAGETSGTMIRALGAGGCLVVVDRGPFAEIPDGAAIRVPWGADFDQRLARELLTLAHDPALRRRIGENAQRFIAANNRLAITVAGYKKAIAVARALTPPAWETQAVWDFLPPQRLAQSVAAARAAHAGRLLPLWFEAGAVPMRGPLGGDAAARVLVFGGSALDADLLTELGYDGADRRPSLPAAPEPGDSAARTIDLIVILSDRLDGDGDLRTALAWLNRALAFGGMLVWSLGRGAGDDARPLLAHGREAALLFEAYGFRIDAAFTGSPPQIDDRADRADDAEGEEQRCWRAFKVSETFARPEFQAA